MLSEGEEVMSFQQFELFCWNTGKVKMKIIKAIYEHL